MKKIDLRVMGLDQCEILTVFGDKRIIKDIKRTEDGLSVETKDQKNIVLWVDGWLLQSNPKNPGNGHKAFSWQPIAEKELVSHRLVNPENWRPWTLKKTA